MDRIIRMIEGHRYDSDRISQAKSAEMESYRDLMQEKMYKIINSIRILAGNIHELGEIGRYWPRKKENPSPCIWTEKPKRNLFALCFESAETTIADTKIGIEMQFLFGEEDESLKKLVLYILKNKCKTSITSYGGHVYYITERKKLICSRNAPDFSQKYAEIVAKETEENVNSRLVKLPRGLNQIPEIIQDAYLNKKELEEKRLKNLRMKTKRLESIHVKDI